MLVGLTNTQLVFFPYGGDTSAPQRSQILLEECGGGHTLGEGERK